MSQTILITGILLKCALSWISVEFAIVARITLLARDVTVWTKRQVQQYLQSQEGVSPHSYSPSFFFFFSFFGSREALEGRVMLKRRGRIFNSVCLMQRQWVADRFYEAQRTLSLLWHLAIESYVKQRPCTDLWRWVTHTASLTAGPGAPAAGYPELWKLWGASKPKWIPGGSARGLADRRGLQSSKRIRLWSRLHRKHLRRISGYHDRENDSGIRRPRLVTVMKVQDWEAAQPWFPHGPQSLFQNKRGTKRENIGSFWVRRRDWAFKRSSKNWREKEWCLNCKGLGKYYWERWKGHTREEKKLECSHLLDNLTDPEQEALQKLIKAEELITLFLHKLQLLEQCKHYQFGGEEHKPRW